jgi:hypothetical protein
MLSVLEPEVRPNQSFEGTRRYASRLLANVPSARPSTCSLDLIKALRCIASISSIATPGSRPQQ